MGEAGKTPYDKEDRVNIKCESTQEEQPQAESDRKWDYGILRLSLNVVKLKLSLVHFWRTGHRPLLYTSGTGWMA